MKVTAMSESPSAPQYAFNYVYNHVDHLGNIRLSYTKDPQTGNLKILEENHYYPFGLRHTIKASFSVKKSFDDVIVAPVTNQPFDYRFQGQELQEEHELNWYSYRYRNYDPTIGRFFNVDPLSESFAYNGIYNFSENRVVDAFELEGLESVVVNGERYADYNKDGEVDIVVLEGASLTGQGREPSNTGSGNY